MHPIEYSIQSLLAPRIIELGIEAAFLGARKITFAFPLFDAKAEYHIIYNEFVIQKCYKLDRINSEFRETNAACCLLYNSIWSELGKIHKPLTKLDKLGTLELAYDSVSLNGDGSYLFVRLRRLKIEEYLAIASG